LEILHYVDENHLSWSKPWVDLLKEMRKQDETLEHVVVCRPGGTLKDRLVSEGFRVFEYKPAFPWLPPLCAAFGRILDEVRPCVIHTRLSSAAHIGGYWGAKKKIPVISTVDKFPKGRYYTHSDVLIAVSTAVAKHLKEQGFTSECIKIVPNPVNIENYKLDVGKRKDLRDKEGVQEGEIVILGMGRFVPWKGFDLLIRAVSSLDVQRPLRLWLVGDGPMKDELMKLAKDVTGDDPGKHVKFFPFAKDVRPFLWASDLFVQPSHYVPGSGGPEAFGLALLEAMASGLPVVAFACGGTLDLVQDGRTGWLAEPGSLDSLKSAISRAINALKFKQREQIDSEEIERFNVKNIAGEFVLLYKNVLSSSAR